MDISVIIPTYNSEKTIGKCIESLLNQSVLPSEIIIADGNSTDGTKKICLSFNSDLVRFVVNPDGHETGSNRNLGAKTASSDYFVFLDSDVVAHKDLIKTYLHEFQTNECVAGNVLVINPGRIANWAHLLERILLKNRLKEGFVTDSFFWVMNFGIAKYKFIGFPDVTFIEDMVFISNLFKKKQKVKFCKEAVVFHNYPETLLDFFYKKWNNAKAFIEQSSNINNIHSGSHFDIILKLMKMDASNLKFLIQSRKVCFDPVSGFSFDSVPDKRYEMERIFCLSAAVAVLEKKGGKLDCSYEELIKSYS